MTDVVIRDQREEKWLWADKRLVQRDGKALGVQSIAVYCMLASYANNDTQRAFPGIVTMAKKLGMSPTTVREALERLEVNGWIKINRQFNPETKVHKANEYILLSAPTTAAVVLPQGRKGTTAGVTELDLANETNPPAGNNGNGTRVVETTWEAIHNAIRGIPYTKGMVVPQKIRGLINELNRAVREVNGTITDVESYYADLRSRGLSATRDARKLQTDIELRVRTRGGTMIVLEEEKIRQKQQAEEYDRIFGD